MILRIAIVVGAALGFVACRPGEGDYCQCADDCRRGLVCAQNGVTVTEGCIDPAPGTDAGRCVEQGNLPDEASMGDETAAPDYHDVGGKRDFEPGMPTDESTSVATSTESTTTTTTATTTGTSTSTDTTTSTSTSTSTDGSASTGPGTSSETTGGSSTGSTGP